MSPQVERFDTRADATQRSPYLKDIQQYPLLKAQQEKRLAKRGGDLADQDAADRLITITTHLRLGSDDRQAQPRLRPAAFGAHLRRQDRFNTGYQAP
jgi:hypothetical protein